MSLESDRIVHAYKTAWNLVFRGFENFCEWMLEGLESIRFMPVA